MNRTFSRAGTLHPSDWPAPRLKGRLTGICYVHTDVNYLVNFVVAGIQLERY
jgi:hypothetical protein